MRLMEAQLSTPCHYPLCGVAALRKIDAGASGSYNLTDLLTYDRIQQGAAELPGHCLPFWGFLY